MCFSKACTFCSKEVISIPAEFSNEGCSFIFIPATSEFFVLALNSCFLLSLAWGMSHIFKVDVIWCTTIDNCSISSYSPLWHLTYSWATTTVARELLSTQRFSNTLSEFNVIVLFGNKSN